MVDTSNSIHLAQIFDYHIDNAAAIAPQYDFVWGSGNDPAGWRSTNATIDISYYVPSARDWGTYSDHTPQTLTWWINNHPDWILYKADMVTPAYQFGVPAIPLDFSNAAVVAWQVATYAAPAATSGLYTSMAADNVTLTNDWAAVGIYSGATPGSQYSGTWTPLYSGADHDAVYATAVATWCAAFITAIHALSPALNLAINVAPGNVALTADTVLACVTNTDMVLDEAGFCSALGFISGANWQAKVHFMQTVQTVYGKTYTLLANLPDTTTKSVQLALASYLMGKYAHAYLALIPTDGISGIYGTYWSFTETNALLGVATSDMQQPTAGVYLFTRAFKNGVVVVNADSAASHTYTLPPVYRGYYDLYGNQYSGTITLAPMTALVLISVLVPYRVAINKVSYQPSATSSDMVVAGSLTVDSTVGRRATAAFTVHTSTATHFPEDQSVAIYNQLNMLCYSGYLTQPQETKPGYQPTRTHTLTTTDQHRLADKRIMVGAYVNRTCGEIVQDIVNRYLAAEGVTVGMIYDGLPPSLSLYPSTTLYPNGNVGLIPAATFVYCTIAAALDALVKEASSAGVPFYWMIDQNKQMWFVPYTAVINPTVVDGTQIDDGRASGTAPRVTRQNPLYRNTQYVTGGVAQTVTQTETRIGDGNTTTWPMGFDLSEEPTITVDSIAKTAGIQGVSTGKDFYWNLGSPNITQDSAGIKLTSSNTLQVVYIGQYPCVIIAANSAQIAYEASIDGTTGIVEVVDTDKTLTSVSNGLSEASALLTRYGVQGELFQFNTLQSSYRPGQLCTVNDAAHGFYNTHMLVEEVSASDQQDGSNIWSTVKMVAGPYDTTWQAFFSTLLAQQQPANSINVGVSQAVTILAPLTMSVGLAMTLTATAHSCPVPNTTLWPNTNVYPC